MTQTFLLPEFETEKREKPVNVASVPQRSPFRYPGGKTWLVPLFRRWLMRSPKQPAVLVEPFAGGGIISLTAAFEQLAERVVMVELDRQIAAVWKTILGGDAEWLAKRILSFELNVDSAKAELAKSPSSNRELAFQTILKNRTAHGGILAEGAGVLKNGENGKGILSRWYPQTIAKRITNIEFVRRRINFIEGDAFVELTRFRDERNAVFFIDPPYTASGKSAGSRLYNHSEVDHERLFAMCEKVSGDFLMTYDNADEVRALAERHGFKTKPVAMKNTHHAEMNELLIGRDLDWVENGGVFRDEAPPYRALSPKSRKRKEAERFSARAKEMSNAGSVVSVVKTQSEVAAEYFGQFHLQCEGVLKQSLAEPNLTKIAASHHFASELALWCQLIGDSREVELFRVSQHEYEYSLLALAQGHYRHAFKSLRLVLELTLQAVYLSANELQLREWFSNRVDTSWSAIVDEKGGVFSARFARGFFPSFKDHVAHYGGMAVLLYRECSECVHGNIPQHIPLPSTIAFEQKTFDLWHSKVEILRLVVHSAIVLRYFDDLPPEAHAKLGSCLGHTCTNSRN